jgi:O-antigen/teichoic acid export membrane protein
MLLTVALRYGSIAVQFVVLAILARNLTGDEYGRYMLVLGAVWSSYTLLGLGASETFVREAPKRIQRGRPDEVAALAGGTLIVALGSAALVALVGGLLVWVMPFDATTSAQVFFIVAFIAANGLVFNAAQMLLGAGFEALGSFFYYPAMNLSLLFTTIPYVALADTPSFRGVAVVTSAAGSLTALVAVSLVVLRIRPTWASARTIVDLVRVGIHLSMARALNYVGAWMPTFFAGVLLAPVQAGYLGTAARMAVAVGALTAAVRFAVRPAIVRAFDRGDTNSIKQTCGRVATAAFAFACVAIVVSVVAGNSIIGIAFGQNLESAAPLLTILLIGTAFEALCGPVDEVLKMTGSEKRVLAILAAVVAACAVAIMVVAPMGVSALAWVQVAYSFAAFGAMIIVVRWQLGIWLRPILPRSPTSYFAAGGRPKRRSNS